ncbi:MAG: TIGR00282 family metallophosphoesterase [Bacilli bacterium]|jgi:metallophosphoesterase (TIGR00282 family)
MRILFIGDIVAKVGRKTVQHELPALIEKYKIDFVIANGENATHGKGMIYHHYQELLNYGIDAITLGNHYDDKSEIEKYLDAATEVVRPLNIKKDFPGVGSAVFKSEDGTTIRITNLLGQAFLEMDVENPFLSFEAFLKTIEPANIHIVDFHGEATAEKQAFGLAFARQVSAVIGTHTHVQTRDYRIIDDFTGYISDVGMTGPNNGVLGTDKEGVISKMFNREKSHFSYDKKDDGLFSAVVLDIDEATGACQSIFPIYSVVKASELR